MAFQKTLSGPRLSFPIAGTIAIGILALSHAAAGEIIQPGQYFRQDVANNTGAVAESPVAIPEPVSLALLVTSGLLLLLARPGRAWSGGGSRRCRAVGPHGMKN